MAFVEFRDVCKVYRMGEVEVAAVDGMSFDIEQGELAVVVGPSGSGKTTLLNMLGGMDSATSGTIRLDGREISAFSERELTYYRRYDIGFVFQFYNLVQNLTALENVELAAQICRDLLLCDEPTGALDYRTGKAILKLLQDTCVQTGRTVVLITHNSAFTAIADRVVHIKEGRVERVVLNDRPLAAELVEW